jgi:hypothetical protein
MNKLASEVPLVTASVHVSVVITVGAAESLVPVVWGMPLVHASIATSHLRPCGQFGFGNTAPEYFNVPVERKDRKRNKINTQQKWSLKKEKQKNKKSRESIQ